MATLWDQTLDQAQISFNLTTARGSASNISAGSSLIGATLESFELRMRAPATATNQPFNFGVWSSSNATVTPTTAFTGSIDNELDLTASAVTYTFTGSHVLAEDDHIGFMPTTNASANYTVARADQATVSDMTMTVNGSVGWINYNPNQIPLGEALGTGVGPTPGDASVVPPPPIAYVRI